MSLPLEPTGVQGSRQSKYVLQAVKKVNLKPGTKEINASDCVLLLTALPGLPWSPRSPDIPGAPLIKTTARNKQTKRI